MSSLHLLESEASFIPTEDHATIRHTIAARFEAAAEKARTVRAKVANDPKDAADLQRLIRTSVQQAAYLRLAPQWEPGFKGMEMGSHDLTTDALSRLQQQATECYEFAELFEGYYGQ